MSVAIEQRRLKFETFSAVKAVSKAKETIMSPTGKTLHWAVDKWLAPTPAMPARVVRFCRTQMHRRCVCVEAARPNGLLSIFFFRHDDGSWNVFPPAKTGPAMSAWRTA
ncbi:hypothetical protein PPGU19_058610 [Paraburkholderia sp. PGU19]|nr:hypothetical protein PPGU19_058610 [Paraburkholderia sp. PGU19]